MKLEEKLSAEDTATIKAIVLNYITTEETEIESVSVWYTAKITAQIGGKE